MPYLKVKRVTNLALLLAVVGLAPAFVPAARAATTGDGYNVSPNAGCDVDAAVPGEQCSLRAAIQRANALAGFSGSAS